LESRLDEKAADAPAMPEAAVAHLKPLKPRTSYGAANEKPSYAPVAWMRLL
jgi:hypothetical protein